MKKNIHPKYSKIRASCSCGYSINIWSTLTNNLTLDVCSNCHPFYTGKQRDLTAGGRINRFNNRFKILN